MSTKIKSGIPSSHVRFTGEEFERLEGDSVITGKSVPTLLKERYFNAPRPLPLMVRVDLQRFNGDMGRIANNLNQIAKKLNSGIREGFVPELADIRKSLDLLLAFMTSEYCRCAKTPGI